MNIYLDIETIPSQDPAVRAEIELSISPPGNYSKPETISKWEKEEKPGLVEQAWLKTGMDGTFGQIICIGLAVDNEPPTSLVDNNEQFLIDWFYTSLKKEYDPSRDRRPIFIGHNVANFDLRFLFQRTVIQGLKPPHFIPFQAKPWDELVFDTMTKWAGATNRVSLEKLCRAFELPPKGSEIGEEMDGSKVWEFFKAGKLKEIGAYCRGDVERVREIHKRMTFA